MSLTALKLQIEAQASWHGPKLRQIVKAHSPELLPKLPSGGGFARALYDTLYPGKHVCAECGVLTKFKNFNKGYRAYCGNRCAALHRKTLGRRRNGRTRRHNVCELEQIFVREIPYTKDIVARAKRSRHRSRIDSLSVRLGVPTRVIVWHMFRSPEIGRCAACGDITEFVSVRRGYNDYCCNDCSNSSLGINKKVSKMKTTNLRRLGVEHPAQDARVRERMAATCMANHGVDHNWKSETLRKEQVERRVLKYGVYTFFNPKRFKYKTEVIDGIEYIRLQGYEGHALRWLLSRGFKVTPHTRVVRYWDSTRRAWRRYLPDLIVRAPSGRVYTVEVKSAFTAGLKARGPGALFYAMRDKARGVLSSRLRFAVLVFDKEGSLVASQAGTPDWLLLKSQLR